MELKQTEAWHRHQMATTERVQADVGRFTRPVMRAMGVCSVAYLASWGLVWVCGAEARAPVVAVAGLSGLVVAMGAPAFALAVGVEGYFRQRLRAMQYGRKRAESCLMVARRGACSEPRSGHRCRAQRTFS